MGLDLGHRHRIEQLIEEVEIDNRRCAVFSK
jgi:hypothetical protein